VCAATLSALPLQSLQLSSRLLLSSLELLTLWGALLLLTED
jgi:hypothetical protein